MIVKSQVKLGENKMTDFTGKVAIITGASGFLASGVVPQFSEGGANLVLTCEDDRLNDRFPELADMDKHLVSPTTDLTDPDTVDQLVKNALDKFGRIDILVNIVGGWDAGKPVHETSIDTWDKMMLLNSKITFLMSRAVVPAMLEQGSGNIVNIGAKPGLKASGNDAAYSASKAAVLRLTESMSEEYKKQGININAVLPSMIVAPDKLDEDPSAGVSPQQIGKVVAYLCSEDASIIHGSIIPAFGQRF